MVGVQNSSLSFTGTSLFCHRIVLSTLSGKPIRFREIREDSTTPGLTPCEVSFVRLMDKLTSGSTIQINETGTNLFYKPGLLIGGENVTHYCHPSRSISFYLEPLLMLAPFAKNPLMVSLHGPTHSQSDLCIDTISAVSLPLLRRLTLETNLSPKLDIRSRAIASQTKMNGGGQKGMVRFECGIATTKLRCVELIEAGFVKRIRGIAFANRVSPTHIGRIVDETRKILNRFSPDVYIHTDHNNKEGCGIGFGLHLVAETTEGCLLGADWSCSKPDVTPEEVAQSACNMLLDEIEYGGCIDSSNTNLALFYCAVADSDVSRIRCGRLSQASMMFMRDLERFFGVVFKVKIHGGATQHESDDEDDSEDDDLTDQEDGAKSKNYGVYLSCVGIGLVNVARQRF